MLKNNIHYVIALICIIGCSSDPEGDFILDDTDSAFLSSDTASDGGPGDTDPQSSDSESSDTESTPQSYTCAPAPLACMAALTCTFLPNYQTVSGKTCPEGQVCCGPTTSEQDTSKPLCATAGDGYACANRYICMFTGTVDDNYRCSNADSVCCKTGGEPGTSTDTDTETDKPLCVTAGEGHECVSERRCRLTGGRTDDDYRCNNTDLICCSTVDEPDTSTETETSKPLCDTAGDGYECLSTFRCRMNGGTADNDYTCDNNNQICCKTGEEPGDTETETDTGTGTRTECPDEYSCVLNSQCAEPDIIHDEFICGLGILRVCCETVDMDAGTLDSGL